MKKDYIRLFGAVSIWAVFNGLSIKLIGLNGTAVGLWTAVVGIIFLFTSAFIRKNISFRGLDKKQILLLSALGLSAGINNVFNYTAIFLSTPSQALLVHYLAPPLSFLWLTSFLKEKLTNRHLLAIALGFVGIAILVWEGGAFKIEKWFIFALISAIFFSGEIVFSKALGASVNPRLSTFSKLTFQIVSMYIGALIFGDSLKIETTEQIALMGLFGGLLYLSFIWVFMGLKTVPGPNFAVMSYIDRFGGIVLAVLILHDPVTANLIVGGGLVLGAQLLIPLGEKK